MSFKLCLTFTRFMFTSVKCYHHPWVVMVVKLSTSSPSTPIIWVQLPLKSTIFIVIFKRSKINEIEAENGPFYKTTLNSRCHFSFHFSYLHFDFVTASKKLFYTSPSHWNENFVRNICVSLNVFGLCIFTVLENTCVWQMLFWTSEEAHATTAIQKKKYPDFISRNKKECFKLAFLANIFSNQNKGFGEIFWKVGNHGLSVQSVWSDG